MKTLKHTFIRTFFYGGLEKEEYYNIVPLIDESNRKTLVILSISTSIVFTIRLLLQYSVVPAINKFVFIFVSVLFIILTILNIQLKGNKICIHISAYIFIIAYLFVGIMTALGPESIQERTTLYLVFISVAPMLYALRGIETLPVIAPMEILYLFLITKYQSQYHVYVTNFGNSVFFSICGFLMGLYLTNIRFHGIYNAYKNAQSEKIYQLNKELEENKKKLQETLIIANEANQAKTTFLSSLSHDIRTPMNAIMGFTSLAMKHIENPVTVLSDLKKIQISSEHLLSLINDVLDMSRIESGKIQLTKSNFSLSEVFDNLSVIIKSNIDQKHQTLVCFKNIQDEYVFADELRLHQILLNILSNATKYTPENGHITFSMEQKECAEKSKQSYWFIIQDTGIGMSQEFLSQLFTPFSREENNTVYHTQGTGLGMAITKNLVDLMHGDIEVESKAGKGSVFIVKLTFDKGLKQEKTIPPQNSHFDHLNVLLVEDNELNAEIACALFEELGIHAQLAENGKEAIEKLKRNTFDVIFMDIQMPVMNGYEAAKEIRQLQDEKKASIPIIAMTANAFEEDKQSALLAGMNAYIRKPVSIQNILETLNIVVNK